MGISRIKKGKKRYGVPFKYPLSTREMDFEAIDQELTNVMIIINTKGASSSMVDHLTVGHGYFVDSLTVSLGLGTYHWCSIGRLFNERRSLVT